MKIPQELPQFTDERALVIVAARQVADIYLAHRRSITHVAHIDVPTPEYSDREGFFARSGRGVSLGAGSVYESKAEVAQRDFLKRFTQSIKEIEGRRAADSAYLFAATHLMNDIREALPPHTQAKLARTFRGNFTPYGPLEILERIAERRESKKREAAIATAPVEAKKILQKARRARRVIGRQAG